MQTDGTVRTQEQTGCCNSWLNPKHLALQAQSEIVDPWDYFCHRTSLYMIGAWCHFHPCNNNPSPPPQTKVLLFITMVEWRIDHSRNYCRAGFWQNHQPISLKEQEWTNPPSHHSSVNTHPKNKKTSKVTTIFFPDILVVWFVQEKDLKLQKQIVVL